MKNCPFCHIPPGTLLAEKGPCTALFDQYPVTEGHVLIVPRRHVPSFRDLTAEEWGAVYQLAADMMRRLSADDPSIAGFNLGINDGEAAGQTISHVHIHLVPRRQGDVANPTGGVRWIFPDKADYLRSSRRPGGG